MLVAMLIAACLVQEPPTPSHSEGVVVIGEPIAASVVAPRKANVKPSVSATVSPRMTTADPWDGRIVTVTVTVRNINEELYCAEESWWIGEDLIEERQSDCDPFEQAHPNDLDLRVYIKEFKFKSRGDKRIRVLFRKSGKTVKYAEVTVHIK